MNRRQVLKLMAGSAVMLSGCRYFPDEGFENPCREASLPEHLAGHELVASIWDGIDTTKLWDCHMHLIGLGDSSSGIWVNDRMQSLWHPIQYAQFKFYLNGSCIGSVSPTVDEGVVERLLEIHAALPEGFRFMLLAFDYAHGEDGKRVLEYSPFYTPNEYAAKMHERYPEKIEWIASIHPYREDAVEKLQWAVKHNARAVKWLPGAMGINAASARCDAFYQALEKHGMPILTHVGDEHAVDTPNGQTFNNPLLFRRALDHGVNVIFAHCATLGTSVDTDKGENGPRVANLDLFARLMGEAQYEGRALGDISAITQVNRDPEMIARIVETDEWHNRLLYGSDYPLPGVMPIFSPKNFVNWGYITETEAEIMSQVREHNPVLFDIMLKRLIKVNGKQFSPAVFETRGHFTKEGRGKSVAEKA